MPIDRVLCRIALAISLLAALPGCPIYGGGGGACDQNADCPPDYRCAAPRCIRTDNTCTVANDCAPGASCTGGQCVTSCRTDGDCPPQSYCGPDNTCTASTACSTDADCTTAGFWCDFRGTCAPRPANACRTISDCNTASQVCNENVCVDTAMTCQLDLDCPAGTSCVDNQCEAICRSNSDCLAGDTCVNSFCRATAECTSTSTCSTGEHCYFGRCLPDCSTASCATGAVCNGDDFCRPSWEGSPFCSVDADCANGRVCRSGVCRTPCPTMSVDECRMFDSQFTECAATGAEYLCSTPSGFTPECRTPADCDPGELCANGRCRQG